MTEIAHMPTKTTATKKTTATTAERAMAKDADARFQSADAMGDALAWLGRS